MIARHTPTVTTQLFDALERRYPGSAHMQIGYLRGSLIGAEILDLGERPLLSDHLKDLLERLEKQS